MPHLKTNDRKLSDVDLLDHPFRRENDMHCRVVLDSAGLRFGANCRFWPTLLKARIVNQRILQVPRFVNLKRGFVNLTAVLRQP